VAFVFLVCDGLVTERQIERVSFEWIVLTVSVGWVVRIVRRHQVSEQEEVFRSGTRNSFELIEKPPEVVRRLIDRRSAGHLDACLQCQDRWGLRSDNFFDCLNVAGVSVPQFRKERIPVELLIAVRRAIL